MGDSLSQVDPVDVGVFADHEVVLLAVLSAFTDQVLVREAPREPGSTGAVVEVEIVSRLDWLAVFTVSGSLPVRCDEVGEGDQQHFCARCCGGATGLG
jgi:hypothetical protein